MDFIDVLEKKIMPHKKNSLNISGLSRFCALEKHMLTYEIDAL